MSGKSFYRNLFEAFLFGGAGAVAGYTIAYHSDKINQYDDEIKELFSQVEKCESSQKKIQSKIAERLAVLDARLAMKHRKKSDPPLPQATPPDLPPPV